MAVRVEGVTALITTLRSGETLVPELTKIAVRVATAAKRLCPVDTGRLRSSIGFDLVYDSRGLVGRVGSGIGVGGGDTVEYAAYIEYGTSRMAAQPFLRPALTSVCGPLAGVEAVAA